MFTLEDQPLLDRLRTGDGTAYREFVEANMGRMLSVARRILRSEEDARDAVQDAFVSALRGLPRFEGNARLSTWLHRIVVNACLMKLRSRRRKPETPIEDLLPGFYPDGHRIDPGPPWNADQAADLESREQRMMVRASIDRLPEGYRTVLLLRDIEGLSTEEAARALETTPEAVKMRLHRARQALRTLLHPHFAGGPS
jgi:RNA polymerase sigma-70 factor (ECF subfamily)